MKEIGIYVHIPFCKQKCYYCDFCSYANKLNMQEKYINSIIKEIKNIKDKEKYLIKTIYIGGGTPSIIDSDKKVKIVSKDELKIKKIICEINNNFKLSNDTEITIEVNPGTVTEKKLKDYKNCEINRLSIGLQSTNDLILKKIGRIHNYNDFEKTYDLARKIGFKNINVDLMIGLPSQTIKDVKQTLQKILQKSPEHISVYSLIVEEGTVLKKKIDNGELKIVDEDTERAMYWIVKEQLEKNNYIQYEISNFSKVSYESKHNTDCWKQKEYIGIGIAAHSYLNSTRFSNICNLENYIKNIENEEYEKNVIIHEKQDHNTMMNEYMILGLRMLSGVDIEEFQNKFFVNPLKIYKKELQKLQKANLLEISSKKIMLTKKGIDFANIVWEEFI